jgi:hypothetical protein
VRGVKALSKLTADELPRFAERFLSALPKMEV